MCHVHNFSFHLTNDTESTVKFTCWGGIGTYFYLPSLGFSTIPCPIKTLYYNNIHTMHSQ